MIAGKVSDEGVPIIVLEVAGQQWSAIVDTGFNGDLELPTSLQGKLNDQPVGRLRASLAGGQVIEEDAYFVEVDFDDRVVRAVATFVSGSQILVGTHLLREHYLQIKFASRTVQIDRE